MKQLLFIAFLFGLQEPVAAQQKKINLKISELSFRTGLNIARLNGSSIQFKPTNKNGFMVGAAYSLKIKKGFGYRTELVFSRQGFSFSENEINHSVTSDYVYMPQFTTFTIAKILQLQLGGQIGYLVKSNQNKTVDGKTDITGVMNRLDYGAAGGLEIYPFKGLIIGGRYNMSLGNSFKAPSSDAVINPLPFNPADVKSKNAVVNFYIGYRF